uniref:Uncharacterized protein n=1 Tax=Cuerna arida TaxID=1464854 RepID=A0A1B6GKW6_9HEMI
MLPYLYQVLRTYAPVVTLPVAIIIGAVGYTIENKWSRRTTPSIERYCTDGLKFLVYDPSPLCTDGIQDFPSRILHLHLEIDSSLQGCVEERRRKRQLQLGKVLISPEPIEDTSTIMPKTILDRNLSPSLMEHKD